MCCRTLVSPWDTETVNAILTTGQFQLHNGLWRREIPEEQTYVTAYQSQYEGGLYLSLSPTVTSLAGHADKRIAASVMYEIATRYGEKVNGVIQQSAINVRECQQEGSKRLLAVYPSGRFKFENLCPGFQMVFLGEAS